MIHLQSWKMAISLFTIPQIYSIASTYKSRLSHRVAVQMILLKRCPNLMYVVYMLTLSCRKSITGNTQCVANMPKSPKGITKNMQS